MTDENDKREARRTRQQVEETDWQWLMGDRRGRRIVAGLLEAGMIDEAPFNGNSRDALLTGRRQFACEIKHRAESASFNDYLTMLKEQHEHD